MNEEPKRPITALNAENEKVLRAGIIEGYSYREIGELYLPAPVPPGTVYRHAIKLGLTKKHPLHGKRGKPFSLNPREYTKE